MTDQRFLQFSDKVGSLVIPHTVDEFQADFTADERMWLNAGKIIEREHRHRGTQQIVDLERFYAVNKK